MAWDKAHWDERNARVIDEFRARGGSTSSGNEIILLTTQGRKSGKPFTTPLMFYREDDRVYVIASKGGSATHPDWYLNLVAHPAVTVEVGPDRYEARATPLASPERERVFAAQAARHPFFAGYQQQVHREIPVVVLERREA